MLKLYKQENNGEIGVLTDATDIEFFWTEFAAAATIYVQENPDDLDHDFHWLLRNGFHIALKLMGYKAPTVNTRQVHWAGDHLPGELEICKVCIPREDDEKQRSRRRQVETASSE